MELRLDTRSSERGICLELSGAITAGGGNLQLRDAVAAALAAGQRRIELDLSGVSYMDSAGLGELIASFTRTDEAGGSLLVLAPSTNVRRLLEMTCLDRVFPLSPPGPAAA